MGCKYCTSGLGRMCQGPNGIDDLEAACTCECHAENRLEFQEEEEMSELYEYERYGYDGDRPCAYFDDLDVITCPRCGDGDILPGERVCGRCRDEILSNEG